MWLLQAEEGGDNSAEVSIRLHFEEKTANIIMMNRDGGGLTGSDWYQFC
jgi:hypothetical protein